MFNKNIINDFPLLKSKKEQGHFVYFDNAATTQKPNAVINALSQFYLHHNNPVHRGIYRLAEEATSLYERARATVANFINAEAHEIVFTKNATEAINFVAATWAKAQLKEGDEILLTELEHHSNLIPWQQLANEKKLILKFIPVDQEGVLRLERLDKLITSRTKLIAMVHVSNAIGTQNNIQLIAAQGRKKGAAILIDAAQSVPHQTIDVKSLDCDFLVFSGHKMLGPTGIGVLFIKKNRHSETPPYQFGGSMVFEASYTEAFWRPAPHCYEAGTPPIAEAIGLAAAINYLKTQVNFSELQHHEAKLCAYVIDELQKLHGIRILGPTKQLKNNGHLVSFIHDKHHAHDIAAYLDAHGICVRSGHYCAQPLAGRLGIESSVRLSFYCYNTIEEVAYFLDVIRSLKY